MRPTSLLLRVLVLLAVAAPCVAVPGRSAGQPATVPAAPTAALVAPESLPQGFVIVVRDKSGLVGPDSPLFLASNHGGWNPGNAAMKLVGRSDGRWQISLPKPADGSPILFKFTRGSWETVEVAADFSEIANRTLARIDTSRLAAGTQPLIELTIEKFADQRPGAKAGPGVDPYRAIKATGEVRRLQVTGGGAGNGLVRDLLVWLPPGYSDTAHAKRSYPVLYLLDGQNVFEQLPGVPGEWRADETATHLIDTRQIEPLIIVAVPNAGAQRTSEYLPVEAMAGVQPRGADFVAWLRTEVMPRVDRTFRVLQGPDNTAIGGSSLGGLLALYAGATHPDIFGKVLAESPSLVLGQKPLWVDLFSKVPSWPQRVYIGMGAREGAAGSDESRRYIDAARSLDQTLAAAGLDDSRRMLVVDPAGIHDETAWARRLGPALKFLFGTGK